MMENLIPIKLFGELAEIAGTSTIVIQNVNNTDVLKEEIFNRYPLLKQKTFLIAIDKNIIKEKKNIDSNVEIALLPPFSGG